MSLTNEDKQWINERLETVLAERLEALNTHFTDRLEALNTHFTDRLDWVNTNSLERLERVETNLITAFQKWASPAEARTRTHSAALRARDLELEGIDDRLKKLEPRSGPLGT